MAKDKTTLSASSKRIDPALDALFSTSSGPVKAPPKARYSANAAPNLTRAKAPAQAEVEEGDSEEDSEEDSEDGDYPGPETDGDGELSSGEDEDASGSEGDSDLSEQSGSGDSEADERNAAAQLFAEAQEHERKQRRKRKQDDFHDLESKYFEKLADDEPHVNKRRKLPEEVTDASKAKDEEEDSDGDIPMHESLVQNKDKKVDELEKASRTVFLSNVSIEAVNSKKAKRKLMAHLSSVLDKEATPPQSIESLRFRSVPFSTAAMPKRAAFITKATMEATTHSANAYAVYSSAPAARTACAKLNGTVVLDRHIRVDSVAHPGEVDHRRCVFVGNLGFVDDETVLNLKMDQDGKEKTEKRKRTRVPMDVEEGLWRTFNQHAGKVESVRVVRDQATRVGKGIAYVQFYDGNSVESALLLNGKKFPPMLPRELRVSRCKAPHKTARAMEKKTAEKLGALKASDKAKRGTRYVPKLTAEQQTMAGRAGKLLGHSAAAKARIGDKGGKDRKRRDRSESRGGRPSKDKKKDPFAGIKTPEAIIFEGRRASSRDATPKDLKMKVKKKSGGKPKPKKSAR